MNPSTYFKKANSLFPGGVNSPVRAFKHVGLTPVFFDRAVGPYLFDTEGKRYVDFCMGFGPHLLGHSPPVVVEALRRQASIGVTFGACHPGEIRFAERILKAYPYLEKLRLVNSGTEAVMTAIRVARGYTGRSKIVKFEGCYHGHSDGLLSKAGSGVAFLSEASSSGVPKSYVGETLNAQFGDEKSLKEAIQLAGSDLAAVILEPIPANHGLCVPSRTYLEQLLQWTRAAGGLVIFDEVITGFRVGANGASGFFDLKPDLVTLGKIIGGGLPVAALVGKAPLLDTLAPEGSVYQAGTLSGNPMGCAVGEAVLREIEEHPPYAILEEVSDRFVTELKGVLAAIGPCTVERLGSMFWVFFGESFPHFPAVISDSSRQQYSTLFAKGLEAGVYFPPSPYEVSFLSVAHSPDVLDEVLARIKKVL